MTGKQHPQPQFTDDEMLDLAKELKRLDEEHASGDHAYELECAWLKNEIAGLLRYEVDAGDNDLASKARLVLETGARQIAEGRPSAWFLTWVAASITRTLDGIEPGLDHAFRLKKPPHRPRKDPYADPAIKAALDHIHAASIARDAGAGAPPDVARKTAVDIAYAVRWRESPQEQKTKGIGAETIRSRRRTLGEALAELGY